MNEMSKVLGVVAMEPKGEYSSSTYYEKLNVVTYEGSSYVAIKASNGVEPNNTEYWQLLSEKGKDQELPRNSKYIGYIYAAEQNKQSIEYITELLTRYKNAGFKESQMLININNDGSIKEDASKFSGYNTIANELNIPITSIKFHGKYTATGYQEAILDCLEYFPNVDTVFVFNEQSDKVYNNGLNLPNIIKSNFSNVKKVGFTVAYNMAFINNDTSTSNWNEIGEYYDLIGVNVYPSCSSYNDAPLCDYEKVLEAFNNPKFLLPWKKEIWVTESGVLPYWQMMELPENYDSTLLTDTTKTTEPQYLFYRALNESNIAKMAKKIIPWYIESGMSDENHELFDILENIITNR